MCCYHPPLANKTDKESSRSSEEDSKLITAVNAVMIGADTPVPHNGNVVQWETIEGGITRETIQDARKIMPRGPSHLEAHTALINNVTIKEAEKMGFDEMGGDFSQDVFRNGWAEVQFANLRWIITIKRTLVPDDTMYMFSDPKFIGKMFLLEDSTMCWRNTTRVSDPIVSVLCGRARHQGSDTGFSTAVICVPLTLGDNRPDIGLPIVEATLHHSGPILGRRYGRTDSAIRGDRANVNIIEPEQETELQRREQSKVPPLVSSS